MGALVIHIYALYILYCRIVIQHNHPLSPLTCPISRSKC